MDGVAAFLREENAELWAAINPYTHVGRNPDLQIRLVHGDMDRVVVVDEAVHWEEALKRAGYDVALTVVEGASHDILVDPTASAGKITVETTLAVARDRG